MAKESSEISPPGIKVLRNSAIPLYIQVYEQFREMILSKRLRPGDRIPASRNLAIEMGVSRVIISQAYEQLMMEGYLVGRTGSGTFVADIIPDHLLSAAKKGAGKQENKLSDQGKAVLPKQTAQQPAGQVNNPPKGDLPQSNPFFGDRMVVEPFMAGSPALDQFPYKAWQQVGNAVLKELKSAHLVYEDTLGYLPLRKAIASYLRMSRAVICEAEQVIVVTGSQQGLNLVAKGLLQKGDAVWMEDPGYPGAVMSFKDAEVSLCPVPVQEDGLDITYATQKYGHAKLAYVTPSHQFPLGYTLSQAKRLQLLEWARDNNMWILEDDYDSEFRYEGRPLESLQGLDTHGRVIYSGTFSKVLFPGLRLAYIVAPTIGMAQSFKRLKSSLDRQSPIIDQLMVSRFMEEGYFLRHIRKMRLLYAERQNILISLLKEGLGDYFRIDTSPSGMHLVCWLSDKIDVERFKLEIRKQQLLVHFVDYCTLEHKLPPAVALGYTAFSKYKLKTAVEKLVICVHNALR
jgi:GntR family transcriptional regulator / MocR family aminotransferase